MSGPKMQCLRVYTREAKRLGRRRLIPTGPLRSALQFPCRSSAALPPTFPLRLPPQEQFFRSFFRLRPIFAGRGVATSHRVRPSSGGASLCFVPAGRCSWPGKAIGSSWLPGSATRPRRCGKRDKKKRDYAKSGRCLRGVALFVYGGWSGVHGFFKTPFH